MSGCTGELEPFLRPYADGLIALARRAGINLRATSCYRTASQQAALYASGRSRPGPILTKLDGYRSLSKHQQRLAFDLDVVGMNRDDVPRWVWYELGRIWKAAGGRWGGDWADFGHFEV
jgi:peptidoglycan L-alanyl-D-glutamate endopeptidase CwlK